MKKLIVSVVLLSLFGFGYNLQDNKKAPNIIVIFMDDMGYGDIGVTGALNYRTPNIDRLASEGIRFTNFLAAQPVCTASRSALLTGCYPNRIGLGGALMPRSKIGLNPDETTMAEMLKSKGYETAMIGKWHLGDDKKFLPLQHGFDSYFGLPYSNDMWSVDFDGKPFVGGGDSPKKNHPPLRFMEGNEQKETISDFDGQDQITTKYTERAVKYIEQQSNKKPFFLYLAHSMPHVPLGVSSKFKGKSKQGMYGDVMMEVDWSVGEIMKALAKKGIDKNTLVIFTSDNGPWMKFGNHAGSTGGFREGKTTVFEGGSRVPCLMRWKGTIPASIICNQLTSNLDIFPTLASIVGAKLPNHKIDGIDILTLLKGNVNESPRQYFYYYFNKNDLRAVRRDNWKLVLPQKATLSNEGTVRGKDRFPGETTTKDIPLALYDLANDPNEEFDVQKQYPEIMAELQKIVEVARQDLGDDLTQRIGKGEIRPVGKVDN